MNTFKYTDHKIEQLIFVCQAESILDADQLLKDALGIDASKSAWIGCQVCKVVAIIPD